MRDTPKRDDFVAAGYELFELTRTALIEGTLSMFISHPMECFAQKTIARLIKARNSGPEAGAQRVALDLDIYTSENV